MQSFCDNELRVAAAPAVGSRPMLSFRLGAVGCLCLLSSPSPVAFAQPASARLAREFQDGVDAYRLGDYAEARVHLEAARQLDPKLPGPHRFLAAVAFAEKRYDDCVESATTALRVGPQSRELEDTRKLHDDCRVADGRPTFAGKYGDGGALSVTATFEGSPTGAALVIDGRASGSTPLYPRAIPAGPHRIKVGRAGAVDQLFDLHVLPGVVTDLEVTLLTPQEAAAAKAAAAKAAAAKPAAPEKSRGGAGSKDQRSTRPAPPAAVPPARPSPKPPR
jgi:hypothetical protein